jgi:peroxiredoxin
VAVGAIILALVVTLQWFVDTQRGVAIAGIGGTQFQMFQRPPMANDFPMGSLDGRTFSLADLKGKVVLLNFWRRNCPYCVREKGSLKKMIKGMNRPDLEVLCVNLWDSPSWVHKRYGGKRSGDLLYATRPDNRQWVMENNVRGRLMGYYVLNENNEAIYEVKGFPSTYVIDKKGRVLATHMGMVDWTNPSVKRWLHKVLGPRPATSVIARSDYVLPKWIDRLLTNKVAGPGGYEGATERRAQLTPRQ